MFEEPEITRSQSRLSTPNIESDPWLQGILRDLMRIHGSINVAHEASGTHLYMASPRALMEDGDVELEKRHLAVNVDKLRQGVDKCASCMKYGVPYKYSELLKMRPLADRGIRTSPAVLKLNRSSEDLLERDHSGNLVPKFPYAGDVVRLSQCPDNHPGVWYLKDRQFDIHALEQQFDMYWCQRERKDLWYKSLDGGFTNTMQGRIIFSCIMFGVRRGWQARIPEWKTDDAHYYWHPKQEQWVQVREKVDGEWKYLDGYRGCKDIAKYLTAVGMQRNACLMGLDAAKTRALRDKWGRRCVFVTEGPLDAGRIGPGAIPLLGKFLSPIQLETLMTQFDRIYYVADQLKDGHVDSAGVAAEERFMKLAMHHPSFTFSLARIPAGVEDPGSMPPNLVPAWLQYNLNQL